MRLRMAEVLKKKDLGLMTRPPSELKLSLPQVARSLYGSFIGITWMSDLGGPTLRAACLGDVLKSLGGALDKLD